MNEILKNLAISIQTVAEVNIPKAYQLGKRKVQSVYGVTTPWEARDEVAVEMLLTRHAEQLAKTMASMERKVNEGQPMQDVIQALINRISSWAWPLSPAMVMGMATGTDQIRNEIGRQEDLSPNDIGILWLTAEDERVCKRCLFLAGRWFDARNAYDIASTIHCGCRCPAHFDVATPDEALVGPIPNYKPGDANMVYADLGADPMIQARYRRAGQNNPSNTARPEVNL